MTTIAFQVRNRRGLGHQMRVANIATALSERHPELVLGFHLAVRPAPGLWDTRWDTTTAEDLAWPRYLQSRRPAVVVYDTVLPIDPLAGTAATTRFVLVARHRHASRAHELAEHPLLERLDRIIVPHEAEEGLTELPPAVMGKTSFVGTITRRPRRSVRTDDAFRLTSTGGGGGFGESTERFFNVVEAIGRQVANQVPNLAHHIVVGPNHRNESQLQRLRALPGATVAEVEPRLIDLIADSDLVIAEGGYNTVNEIRVAQTPAVFVPAPRSLDDQFERVQPLQRDGAALVIEAAEEPSQAARRVAELVTCPGRLASLRAAYRPLRLGNEQAADLIAEVAARCC